MAARANPAGALPGGVLGEARSYAQQVAKFAFCLTQLLPLLRSFRGSVARSGDDLPGIPPRVLQDLESRATDLRRLLGRPLPPVGTPEALAEWLGVPCAIASGVVIPLERIASPVPSEPHVMIEGHLYKLHEQARRPLQNFLGVVRLEAQQQAHRILTRDPRLMSMAVRFLSDVKAILDRYHPKAHGRYLILHHDRHHQLQHLNGHWVLVRGPVARSVRAPVAGSTGRGGLFVGLHIKGAMRAHWLAVPPRAGPTQEGFWTPSGEPLQGGICMGDRRQYRRLLSSQFTDAEAVLEWLDAGVIVATRRSDFHRKWRAGLARGLRARTPAF